MTRIAKSTASPSPDTSLLSSAKDAENVTTNASASVPLKKDVPSSFLFNLTLKEIAALTSPVERARALTWCDFDRDNYFVREVIRSVNVPEAGSEGAALQLLLHPVPKPALRPKKAAGKRLKNWMEVPVGGIPVIVPFTKQLPTTLDSESVEMAMPLGSVEGSSEKA
ncbi:hypothetical protein [Aureimonas psammosilenae]|uniref:hypothetical protein n=1 Tax=Aureimonas psammosilenae TaxID=2495496 RepID=UPI001260B391|nr:hypothetical protein [Aureimonas psammosilenae]